MSSAVNPFEYGVVEVDVDLHGPETLDVPVPQEPEQELFWLVSRGVRNFAARGNKEKDAYSNVAKLLDMEIAEFFCESTTEIETMTHSASEEVRHEMIGSKAVELSYTVTRKFPPAYYGD